MVVLSNGGLPDGSSHKRPSQISSCSSSGVIPNYKPRKVTCVRDFPPMCGPSAPKAHSLPCETRVRLVGGEKTSVGCESKLDVVADSVKTSEVSDQSESHEAGKVTVKLEKPASVDDLVKVGSLNAMAHGNDKSSLMVESLSTGLSSDLEGNVSDVSKELCEMDVKSMVENVGVLENKPSLEVSPPAITVVPVGSATLRSPQKWSEDAVPKAKAKYLPRRVSAIRDFPPFCGINAPAPTEEERRRILSANRNFGEEESGVEDGPLSDTVRTNVEHKPLVETMRASLEKPERNIQDRNVQKKEWKGNVCEPRNESQTINRSSRDRVTTAVENRAVVETTRASFEEVKKKGQGRNAKKKEMKEIVSEPRIESQKVSKKSDDDDATGSTGNWGHEIVVYSPDSSRKRRPLGDSVGLGRERERVIVQGLMAAPNCPWRQGRGASKIGSVGGVSGSKGKKHDYTPQEKSKRVSRTKYQGADYSGEKSMIKESVSAGKIAYEVIDAPIDMDEEDSVAEDEELHSDSPAGMKTHNFGGVSLPPFGPNSSSHGDARNKVRETLRLFQAICRKLLQKEEAKSKHGGDKKTVRIDLDAAKIVIKEGKEVNTGQKILGPVPGVEVGDEFHYRVELALIGVHRLYQAGIDFITQGKGKNKDVIAASIVASGGYADDLDNADVLIYSGQGGNPTGPNKKAEDQKLERGNLALKNSIARKNPVRVIRGFKETKVSSDGKGKIVSTYTYDGLYTVQRYWQEPGPHGKLVFKFELRRNPGQPELAWKEVKKSKKFKTREGLCVVDISEGKEHFPVCAVNQVDNEKPPPFTYINQMIYPDWYKPKPPKGCDCINGCSDSTKCSCAVKNGGEIPFNFDGAIVEVKPLVHECGPYCKCPPKCYNRVSQNGLGIQLEIFKTESRGWGVRSLTSISSGSFICEYLGELLEDKEAEQRTGNDEYLFDIGQNYSDCSLGDELRTLNPDVKSISTFMEEGGYTIDAAQHGNVGRFINHSCSPNLYAQNVIYDHDDMKMPHIMFFAAENIPPLQELTYHYNYAIDQVRDANGDIKKKSCYCGSAECTGRMY